MALPKPTAPGPWFDDVYDRSGRPERPPPVPEPEPDGEPEPEPLRGPPPRVVVVERLSLWRRALGDAWEEGIGGSVLAKSDAVLVVIGVALFVGWSMMHLGPVGRVSIALTLSGSLLAVGLAFQRWPDYRSVALGLSAAGVSEQKEMPLAAASRRGGTTPRRRRGSPTWRASATA